MTDVEIIKQIKKDIYQSFHSDDYIDKFLFKSILHHVITLEIYENNNIDGISFESICANVPKSIGSRSSIQSILNEALEKTIFTKEDVKAMSLLRQKIIQNLMLLLLMKVRTLGL